ncbi:MAG: hypothetical protein GXY36_06245, partial [Chloroflexi bacterium]|nr:hypothetical protein [Chloroflexota bacterium]
TAEPTEEATEEATPDEGEPTAEPTEDVIPTAEATEEPTAEATEEVIPTAEATEEIIPTPEPSVTPTDVPLPTATLMPTATPLPVGLPLADAFESGLGWTASGAWRVEPQGGRSGAGWYADSTQRGLVSTLTYNAQIDLRAAQYPTLSFWQQATLAGVDVASVEVSLDGLSWLPVDVQAGMVLGWSERVVDLSAYRGQLVYLRFRLDTTAVLPDGSVISGWWLDDLLVQDVPPTPTPLPTEPPTATPLPPTLTFTPTATETPIPPTATPTETPVPPTETPLPTVEVLPEALPPVTTEEAAP